MTDKNLNLQNIISLIYILIFKIDIYIFTL